MQRIVSCDDDENKRTHDAPPHSHPFPLVCPSVLVHLAATKFLHCVRTVCALRTQRLGYSPKNTRHLSSSMAKQQSPPVVHVTPFKCPTRSTIVCSCVLCWER